MTADEARIILEGPEKIPILTALSFVSLSDNEQETLIIRFLRKQTQERTAETMDRSSSSVKLYEKSALDKCAFVWSKYAYTRELLKATIEYNKAVR